eukprot:Colp12_sorted_trinity150504_noHs@341
MPFSDSSEIELCDLTTDNVKQFRSLNAGIFPINYSDRFYKEALQAGEFAKLAYFDHILVGGVCCKVVNDANGNKSCYIMTLACLPTYRNRGIGGALLKHILNVCTQQEDILSVHLHVQSNNEVSFVVSITPASPAHQFTLRTFVICELM